MSVDQLRALAADIRLEIDSIARSVNDIAEAHAAAAAAPLSRVALWACGGTLHSFYTGIEKVLELIAVSLNGSPLGANASPAGACSVVVAIGRAGTARLRQLSGPSRRNVRAP